MLTLSLFFFFTYGHFVNVSSNIQLLEIIIENQLTFLLWLIIYAFFSIFFLLKLKNNRFVKYSSELFTIISLTLLITTIYTIVTKQQTSRSNWERSSLVVETQVSHSLSDSPDIFYIIFDRYASNKTLKKLYNYDNSEFLTGLKEKGFFVVNNAHSNYQSSYLSLASSLNMTHLDSLSDKMNLQDDNYLDYGALYHMVVDHEVQKFLKQRGYTYVHIGSYEGYTDKNWNADYNYSYVSILAHRGFIAGFLETTMLRPFLTIRLPNSNKTLFSSVTKNKLQKDVSIDQLKRVEEATEKFNSPKFVFAHIFLPHEPYVFDRDGNYIEYVQSSDPEELKRRYLDQLIYTNTKIEKLVTSLQKSTDKQAVIIIQADEGPYPPRYRKDIDGFKWIQATNDEYQEKTGILNAYFFPDNGNNNLYKSITPVNTFRILFNTYFQTTYPLLPDTVYVEKDKLHFYEYIDVTNKVVDVN